MAKSANSNSTMEKLLASLSDKTLSLATGQEIEGRVVFLDKKEIILDLGTKSEGIILSKDIPHNILSSLKVGDTIKAYVAKAENENGQVSLTYDRPQSKTSRERSSFVWNKFLSAKNQNSLLKGTIIEGNYGGFILEVDGVRGFLPGSQIAASLIKKAVQAGDLIGQELIVSVIEIDQRNNRLIFSQKAKTTATGGLSKFKVGQKVQAKILSNLPFATFAQTEDAFAIIFPQEISWQRSEDPSAILKVGQEIEAIILSLDEDLSRLTLSVRQAQEDPFIESSKKYQTEDTVTTTVVATSPIGITFTLEDGLEGFMPSSKLGGTNYELGQKVSCLVDNIDHQRRKILLSPFLTTTKGLIYK